jgi:hypothetical protein
MSGKHDLPGKADETLLSDDGRKSGRPTKFSEETIERLCSAVADGMPIKGACIVAGIGVTTLNEWRDRYPDLVKQLADARECARLKALQAIRAAADKDWRASAEWLRLTFPADYRGRGAKVEVSATATVSTVFIPEEERQRIIERRRQLLMETDGSRKRTAANQAARNKTVSV